MPKNLQRKLRNMENPLRFYWFSLLVIGISGIIISTISLKSSVKILKSLVKDKSYIGNEPYLAAVVVTLIFGIIILAWGFKNLISSFLNMIRHNPSVPPEFENYDEIENVLVKKQIPPNEKLLETVIKKNKSFIMKFVFFLGFVIIGLLGKMVIPAEFFWDHGVAPEYFSFPLFIVVILAAAAGIRLASVYFYYRINTRETGVAEIIKSIKGESNPYDFVPQIEKALLPMQRREKPQFIFRSGFTESEGLVQNIGKIHKKLFIETYPQSVPYAHHPILYLFLLAAIMLFIIGFFFLGKLPPDNISVLTVPTIAIDYIWTIIKGCILVFSGLGLLKIVYRIFSSHHFESVLVFVEINGDYEKEKAKTEKIEIDTSQPSDSQDIVFRSDCHFKIYTTKLLTEMIASMGKRNIIDMSVETEAEKAKKLIIDIIETFVQKEIK